jgi:metal transporter CNNM
MLASVLASGHSRIPVFEKHKANIVGLLLVKKLIVLDPDDRRPIRDLMLRKPILVGPNESCYSILNEFQKGRSHIALVTKDVETVLRCWRSEEEIPESVVFDGIVTIEDVIEELIQEEIEDESDVYVHDIVDYWQDRYRKVVKGTGATFVKKRLRLLADRARRRVKSRRSKQAAEAATASNVRTLGLPQLDAPIEVKVISEKTPLL